MDHAAALVPFVLAEEIDSGAAASALDPGGEVDVVGNQDRVSRPDAHDQALMLGAFGVVRKDTTDDA